MRPPYRDPETGYQVLPSWVAPEVEALQDGSFRITIWVQTGTNSYTRHYAQVGEQSLCSLLRDMAQAPAKTVLSVFPPLKRWSPEERKVKPFSSDLANLKVTF